MITAERMETLQLNATTGCSSTLTADEMREFLGLRDKLDEAIAFINLTRDNGVRDWECNAVLTRLK